MVPFASFLVLILWISISYFSLLKKEVFSLWRKINVFCFSQNFTFILAFIIMPRLTTWPNNKQEHTKTLYLLTESNGNWIIFRLRKGMKSSLKKKTKFANHNSHSLAQQERLFKENKSIFREVIYIMQNDQSKYSIFSYL